MYFQQTMCRKPKNQTKLKHIKNTGSHVMTESNMITDEVKKSSGVYMVNQKVKIKKAERFLEVIYTLSKVKRLIAYQQKCIFVFKEKIFIFNKKHLYSIKIFTFIKNM